MRDILFEKSLKLSMIHRGLLSLFPQQHAQEEGRIYGFGDRAKPHNASKRPLTQASLRWKR